MGVRKSRAARIATAIRKGSGLRPSFAARLVLIGAMISTVAALLRKGVSAIVAIMTSATVPTGGSAEPIMDNQPAMSSAAPVLAIASLTGMRQASSTRMGHSILW